MNMRQHKSATEVALIGHQEPSLLSVWVSKYWMIGLGVFLAISVSILFNQFRSNRSQAERESRWSQVRAAFEVESFGGRLVPSEAKVEAAIEQVRSTPVEPWALLGLVNSKISERKYDEARQALDRLTATHEPSLTEARYALVEGGEEKSLTEWLGDRISAQEVWEQEKSFLFANKPLPEGCAKVRLTTSAGEIVLGLYTEDAPLHVENFLKHCREGYYNGTKFHRVLPNFMIQGGDPNSKEGDVSTWGLGGPGYTLAPEKNTLFHFRGVLSAAKKPGETESSGSQFFITTGTPHHLDGQHVVFGAVLEGMNIVDEIGKGRLEDEASDRPELPIELTKAEVVE